MRSSFFVRTKQRVCVKASERARWLKGDIEGRESVEVVREKGVGLRREVNDRGSAVPDDIDGSRGLQSQGREDGDGAGGGDVDT